MIDVEFKGRTFNAQGRNGFYRQTGLDVCLRKPNWGEAGAEKDKPPPADATNVVIITGHNSRGAASGHLCLPQDQIGELISALTKLAEETPT